MAYQTRGRDPLLDSATQAAIEKRGRELVGLMLIAVGIAGAAMLGSYTPDDPNWMVASDAPVQNWMGRLGASMSHPIIMIIGRAAWLGPLLLAMWGVRLALHWGEDRALGRLIFAPIAVAVAAVYAATLAPGADWPHSFGLGGLFGDTVLSVILTVLPLGLGLGAKLMSLAAGAATLTVFAYALGFTGRELRLGLRWLIYGIVLSYDMALRLLRRSAAAGAGAVRLIKSRLEERRARRAAEPVSEVEAPRRVARPVEAPEPLGRREPPVTLRHDDAGRGFLGAIFQRGESPALPEPELAEVPGYDGEVDAPDEGRLRSRIADAIRNRRAAVDPEPLPLRLRGPRPLVVDTARPRIEPPVTAPRPPLAPQPDMYDADDEDHAPAPLTATPLFEIEPAEPRRAVVQPGAGRPAASSRARAEAQPSLPFDERYADYEPPPLSLLSDPAGIVRHRPSTEALEENARMLESVLDDYGVKGEIVSVRPGPVVTMYELEPAPGLKASRVIGLADDIARSMSALSARVSTVPGRSVIGIELPNANREKVVLREILSARDFGDSQKTLPLALGKDIGGDAVIANLAKMPHLLIAGTTGSGKSVAINTMILSLLYKLSPEDCRLIMIDPKMLELSVYDGIPHLLSPVVTDPKKAVVALKWVVGEMEERYRKMSKMGVRNIDGYNGRVREALARGECFERTVQTGFDEETGDPIFETEEIVPEKMPYIVVIVDEMADLMMVAGKEIEACIQRLAQMARASGIHLIMATQRPSVDVITGTIKANFPTRISFQVTSKIDSRTILGEQGAEQLLGMGDMLYMAGGSKITRVHGPFCSDEEVEEVVTHLKGFGAPDYVSGVLDGPDEDRGSDIDAVLGLGAAEGATGDEALYDMAVQIAARDRKCSTSYIQRKLAIGYNKAARLVEQMEDQGVVSSANHVGKREVLVPEPH